MISLLPSGLLIEQAFDTLPRSIASSGILTHRLLNVLASAAR